MSNVYEKYKILFDSINWDKCSIIDLFAVYVYKGLLPTSVDTINVLINVANEYEYEKELEMFIRNTSGFLMNNKTVYILGVGNVSFIVNNKNYIEPWYTRFFKYFYSDNTVGQQYFDKLELKFNVIDKTFSFNCDDSTLEILKNGVLVTNNNLDKAFLQQLERLNISVEFPPETMFPFLLE